MRSFHEISPKAARKMFERPLRGVVEEETTMDGQLKAGAATTNITPPLGTSLAGSFMDRKADDVHNELHAKALALDNGETKLGIVVCDLICVGRVYLDQAKELIEERCGIPRSNVMICCTHTHTGPATDHLLGVERDEGYMAFLVPRIADSLQLACRRMREAEIGFGSGVEESLVFNRRYWMKDGTVRTNPGYQNPDVVRPAGPVDPEVGVLCVREPDGSTIALLANYALHYVGGGSGTAVSADYFAFLAETIQQMRGERFVAMLANGACGDVNNVDIHNLPKQRIPYAHAWSVARILACEVMRIWERMDFAPNIRLSAETETLRVGLRKPSEEEVEEAQRRLKEEEDLKERIYAQELLILKDMADEIETYVQVVTLGDLALVALSGEMFVELGLEIKGRSPFERTAVVELANDYVGYVPTRKAFEEGGYETLMACSSKLAPDAGEQMVEAAVRLLERASGDAVIG